MNLSDIQRPFLLYIYIAAQDAITNNWLSDKVYMIVSQQVGVWYSTLGDFNNRCVAFLKRTFRYSGSAFFNLLPRSIQYAESLSSFKVSLDAYNF